MRQDAVPTSDDWCRGGQGINEGNGVVMFAGGGSEGYTEYVLLGAVQVDGVYWWP